MLWTDPVYVFATVLAILSLFYLCLLIFIVISVTSVSMSWCYRQGFWAENIRSFSDLSQYWYQRPLWHKALTDAQRGSVPPTQQSSTLICPHHCEKSNCVSPTWVVPLTSLGKTAGEGDVERRVVKWCVGGWRQSFRHHKVSCCHLGDGC